MSCLLNFWWKVCSQDHSSGNSKRRAQNHSASCSSGIHSFFHSIGLDLTLLQCWDVAERIKDGAEADESALEVCFAAMCCAGRGPPEGQSQGNNGSSHVHDHQCVFNWKCSHYAYAYAVSCLLTCIHKSPLPFRSRLTACVWQEQR